MHSLSVFSFHSYPQENTNLPFQGPKGHIQIKNKFCHNCWTLHNTNETAYKIGWLATETYILQLEGRDSVIWKDISNDHLAVLYISNRVATKILMRIPSFYHLDFTSFLPKSSGKYLFLPRNKTKIIKKHKV